MEVINFIHDINWNDFPEEIKHQARRCLLDTLGAGIAGRQTELSQIIHDFTARIFNGTGAYLWVDGREVSPPGAALANGGRYDHVGEVFGNARPATGFALDVSALDQLLNPSAENGAAIFAASSHDPKQWDAIVSLREAGEKVVNGFAGQEASDMPIQCDRQLLLQDGEYKVVAI